MSYRTLILSVFLSIIPSMTFAQDDFVPVTRAVMSEEYKADLAARKARRVSYGIQKGQDRHDRMRFRQNYAMYYYQAQLYAMATRGYNYGYGYGGGSRYRGSSSSDIVITIRD